MRKVEVHNFPTVVGIKALRLEQGTDLRKCALEFRGGYARREVQAVKPEIAFCGFSDPANPSEGPAMFVQKGTKRLAVEPGDSFSTGNPKTSSSFVEGVDRPDPKCFQRWRDLRGLAILEKDDLVHVSKPHASRAAGQHGARIPALLGLSR